MYICFYLKFTLSEFSNKFSDGNSNNEGDKQSQEILNPHSQSLLKVNI